QLQSNPPLDLYLNWTKDTKQFPSGPFTRQHFLTQCTMELLKEWQLVKDAIKIIKLSERHSMCASAGNRYRNMLWTRDLAYNLPAYYLPLERSYLYGSLKPGEFTIERALDTIVSKQIKDPLIQQPDQGNGYEKNDVVLL